MKAKTVLITGASRGIGRACAAQFVREGHRVIINYKSSRAAAETLAQELKQAGFYARAYCADVADAAQVQDMFSWIGAEFGGVDVLVNNAGIARTKMFSDTEEADWDAVFDVNVKGMYRCTRLALPYMVHKKCGSIVNISSIWGICGASCEVAYSASKAAVIGFTKALAQEVGPSGIRVNCVAPGVIDTDMNRALEREDVAALEEQTPLGRLGTADEVAAAVCFLSGEQAGFITGQVLSPNGGFVI